MLWSELSAILPCVSRGSLMPFCPEAIWTIEENQGMVRVLCGFPNAPWIFVEPDCCETVEREQECRFLMALEIAQYLNGDERPKWLEDFYKVGKTQAKALSGAQLAVVGPLVIDGTQCKSPTSIETRERLLDLLLAQ